MSIKRSLAWMGGAQAATFLFQFGASVVLARYLTPHEMGVFALSMAAAGLLSLLQSFGLQPLIVREETLENTTTATAFTINAVTLIVLSFATFLFGMLGKTIWGDDGVRKVLWVIAVSPLFGIPSFLPGAQLERNGRFKEFAMITTFTGLVGAISTITFVLSGYSYMSMAYAYLISSASLSIGIIWVGYSYFDCRLSLQAWRRVLRFSANMFAISTVTNFSARLSELCLGRILDLGSLGLYNRASSSNTLLWTNIHALLGRVVLVDFARLHREGKPLRHTYVQTAYVVTGLLWPAFAGLAILSKPFILILFGDRWLGASVPLSYLAIASMFLVATTMSWELCTATGNIRIAARVEGIRAGCSVPLFIGACFISLEAAAFTRIIDALLALILYQPHLKRMSQTSLRDLGPAYLKGVVLTLVAITPSALLISLSDALNPGIPWICLSVSSGGLLWLITLFVIRHPLGGHLVSFLPTEMRGYIFASTKDRERASK